MNQPLVTSEWLNENLGDPNLIILDATQIASKAALETEHGNLIIEGAQLFDIKNAFSDQSSVFPNTFPNAEQFDASCRKLGISNSSVVVVYDNRGVYSSPRAWWMLKVMGLKTVYVLDGGLKDWIDKGFKTQEQYSPSTGLGDFKSVLRPDRVKDHAFVESNIQTNTHTVIDARSKGRFDGTAKEPREGLRSGHIQNSINIPFTEVLESGKFKSKRELEQLFQEHDLSDKPLVFSCGSGITACIVLLASKIAGDNDTSVYDGSWTEWATLHRE